MIWVDTVAPPLACPMICNLDDRLETFKLGIQGNDLQCLAAAAFRLDFTIVLPAWPLTLIMLLWSNTSAELNRTTGPRQATLRNTSSPDMHTSATDVTPTQETIG